MRSPEMEAAAEMLMHQIAAGVHRMLYARRCTVALLKSKLESLPKDGSNRDWADLSLVDDILAGRGGDKARITHLADIAFVLECEWDVKALRIEKPEEIYTPSGPQPQVPEAAAS